MKCLADVKEVTVQFGASSLDTHVFFDGEEEEGVVTLRLSVRRLMRDENLRVGSTLIEERTVEV